MTNEPTHIPPPPPPPPPPGGKGKKTAEQEAQAARKRRLEEAKLAAEQLAKASPADIKQNITDHKAQLKKITTEKNQYIDGVNEEGHRRKKIYEEREEILTGFDQEIANQEILIQQLAEQLKIIPNSRADLQNHFQDLINKKNQQLNQLKASKPEKIRKLNAFIKEYETKTKEFELLENIQKTYINTLEKALTPKAAPVAFKKAGDPLKNSFALLSKEFAKLENYTPLEKILIKNYYFEKGENGTEDRPNALEWTDAALSARLQSDIQLQKLTYHELKKAIGGRSLFVDENNPAEIAKPPKSEPAERKVQAQINVSSSSPPSSTKPLEEIQTKSNNPNFSPPLEKALSNAPKPRSPSLPLREEAPAAQEFNKHGAKVASDFLAALSVRTLYHKAKVNKTLFGYSFHFGYAFKRRDRAQQLNELQQAVVNAQALMLTEPANALAILELSLQQLDNQLKSETRHLGASRLQQVADDLRGFIKDMRNDIFNRHHQPTTKIRPQS